MKNILIFACTVLLVCTSCATDPGQAASSSAVYPDIFPDYTDVTIPVNIAPLNFEVRGASAVKAEYRLAGKSMLTVSGESAVQTDEEDWHQLISAAVGSHLDVTVSVWSARHPQGVQYRPFHLYVSPDSIDPWIAYRLVDPGYEPWGKMGIMQRSLENFDETPIADNFSNRRLCVNCHSFCEYDAKTFMLHQRSVEPGTIIVQNGTQIKLNFKEMGRKQPAIYPKWHPSGRYIVFATCDNHQSFKNDGDLPLEVYDFNSDLFIYDLHTRKILYDDRLNGDSCWQSFPTWTPDGRTLIYACCNHPVKEMPDSSHRVHYDIMSVPFNAVTGKLGSRIDTLYSSYRMGGSASYPRVSADGRYLLFTVARAGTFPIWHPDADLAIMDLRTRRMVDARVLNSRESDSYHCWSSTGRWLMFSSRRMDGRHTRLMLAGFDRHGHPRKPFMLPQRNPEDNWMRIQSYNIPEFIKSRVTWKQGGMQ